MTTLRTWLSSAAQRDNKNITLLFRQQATLSSGTFKQGERKLQRHHADVDGLPGRRLKQYRVHVEVTQECRSTAGSMARPTSILIDRPPSGNQTSLLKQRRAHQRMVLPTVKTYHRPCQRPTAAEQSRCRSAGQKAIRRPRETAVQVGNGAQPEDQTLHDGYTGRLTVQNMTGLLMIFRQRFWIMTHDRLLHRDGRFAITTNQRS